MHREARDCVRLLLMKAHAVTHLITFNADDFKRFSITEITVVTPAKILRAATSS